MYKTPSKNKHARHSDYDLYNDIENIKNAFTNTAMDVRGKTGEILAESIENIKKGSTKLQDNLSNYTAEKPFKSLGIVLLAGIAIGYFLRR